MNGIRLRERTKCPDHTIVVFDGDEPESISEWHYGPHTRNAWPEGDYYENGEYQEPAFDTYDGLRRTQLRGETLYLERDPDFNLDIGL